ncbi:MAG: type II secretion system F family protein [Tepidisphaeraceae bacterium]
MPTFQDILFLFCVTGCVGAVVYLLLDRILDRDDRKIAQRLAERDRTANDRPAISKHDPRAKPVGPIKTIVLAMAKPFMPDKADKMSGMRAKLAMAGIYDPAAGRSLVGWKFIGLGVGVCVGWVIGSMAEFAFLGAAVTGLIGYLAPKMWLKSKIGANQKAINVGLPDALDLMVICVESGLTIDSTLLRVGDELALSHPAVAREFGIAHTETRLGVSRQVAFRNMATRTGNVSVQGLAAMLIQADRFGTGIGHALRILAESMRVKRQNAAEELAAKASVKMSFPLVLFVFPATFIVLAGPTVIQLMNSSLMNQ